MAAAVTVGAMAVLMVVVLTTTSATRAAAVAAMVVAEATAIATVMAAATAGVKRQQSTSVGTVKGGRWTRAQRRVTMNNESVWLMMRAATKRVARGKGDGNDDEGGGRVTATMVKNRAKAARAMVKRVVGDEEGDSDGGNMVRTNDDGLVPIIVQQPVLYSSSASLDDAGDDKSTGR
jgi:hypothetical protein